jgi:hypothetical protein
MASFADSRRGGGIPAAITTMDGNLVRAQAIALIPNNDYDSYYPEVVVSYATGRRSNDAEGTGPGMYYANQLMMFLYGFGIQCFSGLHVPSSKDWKTFMKRLEVLIVELHAHL